MAKKGKITVKHFLNLNLKPIERYDYNFNLVELHPVYIQIGYKRKVNKIKSKFYLFGKRNFQFLESFDSKISPEYISKDYYEKNAYEKSSELYFMIGKERAFMSKFIEFVDWNSKDFSLKGIARHYDDYTKTLIEIFDEVLISRVSELLFDKAYQHLNRIIDWNIKSSDLILSGLWQVLSKTSDKQLLAKIESYIEVSKFILNFNIKYGGDRDIFFFDWYVKELWVEFSHFLVQEYPSDEKFRKLVLEIGDTAFAIVGLGVPLF